METDGNTVNEESDASSRDRTNRDGFASMAILALTVAFIVFVLIALI